MAVSVFYFLYLHVNKLALVLIASLMWSYSVLLVCNMLVVGSVGMCVCVAKIATTTNTARQQCCGATDSFSVSSLRHVLESLAQIQF